MNIIKKYLSYDLRGNKIINAIFNNPTLDGHAVNKKFHDDSQNYDTDRANLHKDPPKFNWLTQIQNKPFKQLFDELFFPTIIPIYTNPIFKDVKLSFEKNFTHDGKKELFFNMTAINFLITFNIDKGDRLSNVVTTLEFEDTSGTIYPFYTENTSDETGTISGEFILNYSIKSIKLKKNWNPAEPKLDNDGNISIPSEFQQNYLLVKDLTQEFLSNYFISYPILWKNINIETDYSIGLVNDMLIINSPGFTRGNTFLSNIVENKNLYSLLIPQLLYDSSNIFIFLGNDVMLPLSKKILKPSSIDQINLTENNLGLGSLYHICTIDLGHLTAYTKISLDFKIK